MKVTSGLLIRETSGIRCKVKTHDESCISSFNSCFSSSETKANKQTNRSALSLVLEEKAQTPKLKFEFVLTFKMFEILKNALQIF